jgi:hypothetical protein
MSLTLPYCTPLPLTTLSAPYCPYYILIPFVPLNSFRFPFTTPYSPLLPLVSLTVLYSPYNPLMPLLPLISLSVPYCPFYPLFRLVPLTAPYFPFYPFLLLVPLTAIRCPFTAPYCSFFPLVPLYWSLLTPIQCPLLPLTTLSALTAPTTS